jgi:tetratricopeptide (TPR) repeat protein
LVGDGRDAKLARRMADETPRYWAFLSYSHADVRWARWLHAALEGYVTPRRLVGRSTPFGPAPRRLRPIFRDRDELSAVPDLGARLVAALEGSAYLIVICSPAAARSAWVEEEIRQFKRLHGEDRVLAVIAAGEPFASDKPETAHLECFPEALRTRLGGEGAAARVEPVAADLRPGKDGRQRARLKLISGMLQIDLDEVVQRDAQRRHQQLLALTSAAFVGAGAMGALSIVAVGERNEAVAQRAQAEGLIEFMIGDLRKTLEPAGRLDALDAIGARALGYYATQNSRGLDAASLGRRARVLQVLGLVREQRGDLPAALRFFEESAKSTGELLAREPDDPQRNFDHAQSVDYIGEVAFSRGDNAIALRQFEEYRRLANRLVQLEPRNQNWQAEVEEANTNLGAVLLREGRGGEAVEDFSRALAISQRLARAAPNNRDRAWDLSQIYAWIADAEVSRGRLDEALSDRQAEGAIYARLIANSPSDTAAAADQAAAQTAIAKIDMQRGQTAQAIVELKASLAEVERLIAQAPDNETYKANAAPSFLLLGRALLQTGQLNAANEVVSRMLAMSEAQVRAAAARKDQGIAWQGARLGEARVLACQIAAAQARSPAAQRAALAPATAEAERLSALSSTHPTSLALARVAAEAALLAGDHASLAGEQAKALSWWSAASQALGRSSGDASHELGSGQSLLRQLDFRLRSSRPPPGPLPDNPPNRNANNLAGIQHTIDYEW